MRNIKLTLEYDGTDFSGWQYQPGFRTIQHEIESSLKIIFNQETIVIGAGRTDAGVHALGQVANFTIDSSLPLERIKAALNGTMSRDVRVKKVEEVPENFNSRYDAIRRHYRYTIIQNESALKRHYAWCFKTALNIDDMQRASDCLIGEHDFRAFCQAGADVKHHRCVVEEARWQRQDDVLTFDIKANRFLHNMVRIIVGTVVNIGRGHTHVEQISVILNSKDRIHAGPTVPAKGLCLVQVYY
ncbi:MAG: tRNA pseudouridine(38-40) synthase TruA [Candidatus Zhuqueibacterota bacterium]